METLHATGQEDFAALDEAVLQQRLWRLKDEHSRTTDNPTRRVFLERRIMEVLKRLDQLPKPVVNW